MASRHYRFDTFELDARSRELRNADTPVALPLKSFDCLVYLIEHRDRAVGRDELISAVWGRADVSDALLGQTLARARRAIGDTGDVQGAIRTVPRFGYHWVKPIVEIEPVASTEPAAADLPATPTDTGERASIPRLASRVTRPMRSLHVAWIAAVVVAAVLIASAAWMLQHRRGSATPGASQAQPAAMTLVLPVAVADADPQSRWIRLGAMDYLASRVRERAHQPVLPSEQAIALLAGRDDEVLADPAERLKLGRSVGATRILSARVRREREGWTFVIGVQEEEGTREYVGTAVTPLQAADVALGAFFERIGAGVFSAPPQRPTLVELQQRIDAAFLDGDLEAASEAIESAPVDLQKDPAIAVRAAEIDDRAGRMELAARGFSAIAEDDAHIPAAVLARARYGLCVMAFHLGDLPRARSRCSDALAALVEPSDPMLRGRALNLRAVVDDKLGHFDEAMAGFGLARIEWRRAGNLPGEASVDGNEAMSQARRGRFAEAMAAFDRAIAVFTRFGVQDHLASTLAAKSDAQRMVLDLDDALATSTQAWQMTARIGNETTVRAIGYSHALALLANGRLDEAARIIGRFDVAAGAPTEFSALGSLLLAERGIPAEAIARADAIFDLLLAAPTPPGDAGLSEAAHILIDAALEAGNTALAMRLLSRLQGAGASTEDAERGFVADLAQAHLASLAGDERMADARFRAALDYALGINRPDLVAASASPYVLFLLSRHRDEDATRIAGRLTLYADKDYTAARTMASLYERIGDARSAQNARARVDTLAGQRGHSPGSNP